MIHTVCWNHQAAYVLSSLSRSSWQLQFDCADLLLSPSAMKEDAETVNGVSCGRYYCWASIDQPIKKWRTTEVQLLSVTNESLRQVQDFGWKILSNVSASWTSISGVSCRSAWQSTCVQPMMDWSLDNLPVGSWLDHTSESNAASSRSDIRRHSTLSNSWKVHIFSRLGRKR